MKPTDETFILEPLRLTDAESLCQTMVRNSERFKLFFPITLAQNLSIEASKVFIRKKIRESKAGTEFTLGIKECKNLSVVGLIILKELNYEKGVGELAYCIDVKYQGKSWTTKGVKYMCNYAFEELKLDRLRILVHNSNIGSLKVAKSCGFKWKMTLPQEYTPPNSLPLDMELYELTGTLQVGESGIKSKI